MQRAADAQLPAGLRLPGLACPGHPLLPAAGLNEAISLAEVRAALARLHHGRAHGPAGLPAELLRHAQLEPQPGQLQPQHVLAPVLVAALNSMFEAGSVPADLNLSLVTPVFKRGDQRSTANYRAIAVGEPVLRLYAGILNQRLLDYTEQHGLRAPSQAGFRPQLSVVHQLFSLVHLSQRQRQRGQPLYVCFLDLQGAFDRVARPLLWQALQRLGLHGRMLAAVQSLYSTASVAVRVEGRQGPALPSRTGVKQGCPLSPTLFGLLADGLHRSLQLATAAHGVAISPGLTVTDLGYADDFALLSGSAAGLQALISAAEAWCAAVGMLPSPAKMVVLELTGAVQPQHSWHCGAAQLSCVPEARYLGLLLRTGAGLQPSFSRLEGRMWAAHSSLRKRYSSLGCGDSVWLPLQLHAACVEPAGSFGCELWAVSRQHGAERQRLEAARLRQVRQLSGLARSVALPILWRELGLRPLGHAWLLRAATFWNALATRPGFHQQLALDSVHLAVSNRASWASGLRHALRAVGYHLQLSVDSMPVIDLAALRHCLSAQLSRAWEGLAANPRLGPSEGARLCTYLAWFSRPAGCRTDLLRLPVPHKALVCLLRLRTGCHSLPNVLGSWQGVPRSHRSCPLCAGPYCDERHALLECPALVDLRARFGLLFRGPAVMRHFMWQPDMILLARYVSECLAVFAASQQAE